MLGWAVALPALKAVSDSPWPTWAIVVIAILCSLVHVDVVAAGRHMTSIVLTDAAIVFAALLGEPIAMPLAIAAAMTIAVITMRPPPIKVMFNLGQELTGALLAMLAFTALRDDELVSLRTGIAALVAGCIVGAFSAGAIWLGTLVAGSGAQRASVTSLTLVVATSFANAAVALQVVYLGSIALPLAAVPLLPLAVLYVAYAGIRKQQHSSDRTELLYRAISTLHEEPSLDVALLAVLDQVRTAVRGEAARVVLLTPEGAVTCQAASESAETAAMAAAPATMESAARRLAAELPGAVLVRAGTPAATQGPVSVFAQQDAIVAPLVRDSEPAGIVVVAGKSGGLYQLYQSDVDLMEVLAKQIGLALERGFLEKSLQQLIELEQQLTRQAYYDAVTGLANRNFLNEELAKLLRDPTDKAHAVLLVDLDDFKTVNDSLGHVAGDRLLADIAERLVRCVGEQGVVARIGGDEFAVILPRFGEAALAADVATDVIREVKRLVELDRREISVGASVGIRMTSGFPDSATDVIRDADLALYYAKSLGKGRSACYEPSMHVQVQERLMLTAALANAVDRDEFSLVFQPIFELGSSRFTGVEALVRWRHPERGELLPGQFLALTEETGLIVGLGRHILRRALEVLCSWDDLIGGQPFYMAVNVSGRQLQEDGFAESVLSIVGESGVDPRRVLLEITESVFIGDTEDIREKLERLSAGGLRLGLDDFGTGYASLSQLQRFHLDQLKIDRAFVSRLDESADDRLLVRAIVQLAGALQMDVVAEGIETEAQLQELMRLGCKRGQGWLLGRPRPAPLIERLLSDPDSWGTTYPPTSSPPGPPAVAAVSPASIDPN